MSKKNEQQLEESTPEATTEEPKLTPLQRMKQQQALLRKNRNIGAQRPDAEEGGAGGADSPTRPVTMHRRSGSS